MAGGGGITLWDTLTFSKLVSFLPGFLCLVQPPQPRRAVLVGRHAAVKALCDWQHQ